MQKISRAGYSALVDYQYAHEDRLGGVDLSGRAVTVTVVRGPTASGTTSEMQIIIDRNSEAVGDYSLDIRFVEHSYSDLYAIMYVLPRELGLDTAQTQVHCSVDILHNRVKARFDPLTAEIAVRAAQLWGPMVEVEPLPADTPRLAGFPARRKRA